KIIHFTEDSGDIQVRYDIVHIAEAFSSSNLVSAFSFTFVYPIELTLKEGFTCLYFPKNGYSPL
ncbi:MAG: hypothetical protein KGQ16_12045, partial [Cyanobacteria bacterium REEB444]|nr:hypothetical protein [Cyanobacteria bacterium REEB444]